MLMLKSKQMKQRSTTPVSISKAKRAFLLVASALVAISSTAVIAQTANADQFDEKIAALQKQIDGYNSQASELAGKRQTLENELAKLNNQKAQIQAQIDLYAAKAKKLASQIKKSELEISQNKDALGSIMTDIALDEDISTIEMLASSKNISDFLDKQTYQATVQQNLTDTITRINDLKKKLEKQKKSVDRILAEQKLARDALAEKEAAKNQLIAKTRGEESAFQKLSAKAEAQQLELQKQQQAAIEAAIRAAGGGGASFLAGDPNHGGYPWESGCYVDANAYSNTTDPLGYGCRQCVSYTAWKVGQRTGNFPRYWGNANMWPGSARASGYSTGSTPRANSVGVISAGYYGHTVWVNSVNGDGTVNISQYNYYNAGGPGWGHYSEMRVPAWTYDTYIYF